MDDALVLTMKKNQKAQVENVLILVVMDDALVLQILVYSTTLQSVLILVVMDDALVQNRRLKRPLPP